MFYGIGSKRRVFMKKSVAMVLCLVLVFSLALSAAAISTVPLKSIKLDVAGITLKPGGTHTLEISYTPADTTQKLLSFTTSDKNVVSVNADGTIKALKGGRAVITVASTNPKVAPVKCVVTVNGTKTKIHFSHWFASNDPTPIAQFKQAEEEFEALNPDIDVILDPQPTNKADDYMSKYDLLLLSGDKTDIIQAKSVADYATRVKRGLYAPLDSYMAKESVPMTDYLIDLKQNGNVYGLPWNLTSSLVLINKDMLDAAGLPAPPMDWTWDTYRAYAKAMTKGEGAKKVYGSILPFWGDPVYYYIGVMQTKMDNPLFKDENTHNFSDPVLKAYLKLRYDMENVDKSEVSYLEYTSAKLNYQSEFFKSKAAMLCTGTFSFGSITNFTQFNHDFKTLIAPSPLWKNSPIGRERGDATISCVNAKISDANKEAAFRFIKYFSQQGFMYLKQVPAYRKADMNKVKEFILNKSENSIDVPSLENYLNFPQRHENVAVTVPAKDAQMKAILKEETEKYLSNSQTLDQAITNMINRADTELKK
jgi:multiple sugar transport system substrate-binding protein